VLHIDDDANDSALLKAAMRKAGLASVVHNVEDGKEAILYLSGAGEYKDRTRYRVPDLILLDLRMPGATGFEVLEWIRAHPELAGVPVIVLSGSDMQEDIRQAYAIGADSYLIKPLGFEALVKLVKRVNLAWLGAGTASREWHRALGPG
jgi:CheY-like chemotaxis protein